MFLVASALGSIPCLGSAEGAQPPSPFEPCLAAYAEAPRRPEPYECLVDTARATGRLAEAERILWSAIADHPELPWPRRELADLRWRDPSPDVDELYEAAARLAAPIDPREGWKIEIQLADRSRRLGRPSDALERLFDLETRVADHPAVRAEVEIYKARARLALGRDLGIAADTLRGLDRSLLTTTTASPFWNVFSEVHRALGRSEDAAFGFRNALEIAQQRDDRMRAASARLNLAVAQLDTGTVDRQSLIDLVREAASDAQAAGRWDIASYAMRLLTRLDDDPNTIDVALDRCLEFAEQSRRDGPRVRCLLSRAVHQAIDDRDASRRDVATVHRLVLEDVIATGRWDTFRALWPDVLLIDQATRPLGAVGASTERLFDLVDALRHLQTAEADRPGWLSTWADAYRLYAGGLLSDVFLTLSNEEATADWRRRTRPPERRTAVEVPRTSTAWEQVGRALRALERLRARSLADAALASGAVARPTAATPAIEELRDVLERRVLASSRLFLDLEDTERAEVEASLASLAVDEEQAWRHVAAEAPSWAAARATPEISLGRLQQAVADNEALIVLLHARWRNVYDEFDGGSWALAVLRERVLLAPVPAGPHLQAAEAVLDPGRLDGARRQRLTEMVFGDLLASLGPDIRRVVIVPDGAAHRLPLAALAADARSTQDEGFLSDRFEVSVAPSLTLWRAWRGRPANARASALVAMADPPPPQDHPEPSTARWLASHRASLVPLPAARREAAQAQRRLGGLVAMGDEATEAQLERLVAEHTPTVVHLAAHALADLEDPQRSAVVLAADETDDGLLQPAEIGALDLRDAVVVLSTCDSARGAILRGEGVLSLARPFFQAGARSVVASVAPVPDRATAALFDRFYAELADGASVAGALTQAQRTRDEGAPPADWAHFVVVGDGAFTPFTDGAAGAKPNRDAMWTGGAALLALGAALGLGTIWRRRQQESG
ncbi:MAG: CHAT domain-containing protein [Acidobacteriota bacterium]